MNRISGGSYPPPQRNISPRSSHSNSQSRRPSSESAQRMHNQPAGNRIAVHAGSNQQRSDVNIPKEMERMNEQQRRYEAAIKTRNVVNSLYPRIN